MRMTRRELREEIRKAVRSIVTEETDWSTPWTQEGETSPNFAVTWCFEEELPDKNFHTTNVRADDESAACEVIFDAFSDEVHIEDVEPLPVAEAVSKKGAKKQLKALGGPKFSDKVKTAKDWGCKDPEAFVASRMDVAHGKSWRKKEK